MRAGIGAELEAGERRCVRVPNNTRRTGIVGYQGRHVWEGSNMCHFRYVLLSSELLFYLFHESR